MSEEKNQGVTLIELIVTLLIASLTLLGLGKGLYQFYNVMQSKLLHSELLHAIALAESEALSQDQSVTLSYYDSGWVIKSDSSILYRSTNKIHNGKLYWRAFPFYLHDFVFLANGSPDFQNGTIWYCRFHEIYPDWAVVINQVGRSRTVWPNERGEIVDEKGMLLECK